MDSPSASSQGCTTTTLDTQLDTGKEDFPWIHSQTLAGEMASPDLGI